MIWIIIYIIGFILCDILMLYNEYEKGCIMLKDIIICSICSIISWFGILIIIFVIIQENWNEILIEKK